MFPKLPELRRLQIHFKHQKEKELKEISGSSRLTSQLLRRRDSSPNCSLSACKIV